MINTINDRVLDNAITFINTRSTVRQVAKITGCSKSTVHKDLTERLERINFDLYLEAKKLLSYNKGIRHVRGGEATKKRYLLRKSQTQI